MLKEGVYLLYLFWQLDCFQKPPGFSSWSRGLNKKFKTSYGIAAVWSDIIYGKWTGLAK